MKKILSLSICFILLFSLSVTAAAEGSATLSGNTSATVDGNVEFTVSVSGCGDATSAAVSVTFGDGFEFVSGSWLKSGGLNTFDTSTKKGALGQLSSPNINGNLFKLVLKAKTASPTAQHVSVTVTVKNGANTILSITPSKSVKINCKTHAYGSYANKDGNNHTRTCSVCGSVETKAHTWDSGRVDKAATCKAAGVKTFTCTACKATKTQTIAKTDSHSFGAWSQTKAPTCTEKGSEKRTCSVCGKTETRDIAALGHKFSKAKVTKEPTCTEAGTEIGTCTVCGKESRGTIKALGHDFGKWSETKAATCTEKGEEERKCARCDKVEKRETEALEHDFEDPEVVKEATIYSTGLMQGKCKRCGETTEQIIPCTYTDEKNGVKFEAEEGVFREGTQITVNPVDETNANYETAKNVLATVASEWIAYDISALRDGAKIQPNGKVKVSFEIPEGYGRDVAVYYIGADGTCEKIDGEISEDGKTVTAELEHFSLYAVCKAGTEDAALAKETADTGLTDETGAKNENGTFKAFLVLAAVFALVLILVAIVVAIWILKRNDRRRYRF